MTRIVVGVDGSPSAADALRWAEAVGARHGWVVRAVLGWDTLDQYHPDRGRRHEPDYGPEDALEALTAYVEEALGPERAAAVERVAIAGVPAEVLGGAAADAAVLVVGARGRGALRAALLGSVGLYCAQTAPCPVAIVRGAAGIDPEAPRRIVVGVDGSGPSRRALDWALDDARLTGAEVDAVHVWRAPFYGAEPYAANLVAVDEVERGARELLELILREADQRGLEQPPEAVLVEGSPSQAMLDIAKGADLVVVGSRGRGGFAGLLLGSVSQQLAHHATCPVVIVPPAADGA